MSDSEERVLKDVPRENGRGEVIRAAVSEFKGRPMFSVRVWWDGDSGQLKPSKNGINLARSEWPRFWEAVQILNMELGAGKAEAEAKVPHEPA